MIMRITHGKLHPGTWPQFEATYNAIVVPKSLEIAGLRGRWLVQDLHDPDAGCSVSLWESLEDLRAYEQSAFFREAIFTRLQPFFLGEFTTHYYAVKGTQSFPVQAAQAIWTDEEYWEDFATFR